MNLVNLCLRIPNLGILIFYLIFIVIIPYLLVLNKSIVVLKFYLPMLVAFANLLSKAGNKKVFENLYELQPKNFISFLSSNFINLFALFGILWQCLEYSKTKNGNVTKAVVYGAILFIIALPLARNGLQFVLNNVDFYLREKTKLKYQHNWHLLVFGLLYIIFLLGLQAVLLALVDSTDSRKNNIENIMKNLNENNRKNKINRNNQNNVNNKNSNSAKINDLLNKIEEDLVNNAAKNNKVNNKNNKNNKNNNKKSKNLLKNQTLTNLGNLAKKMNL